MSMKKLIAILMAGVMLFMFAACGGNNEEETTTEEATVAEEKSYEWMESAEDFVYNAPSYLGEDPVMWTPPTYGGFIYQLIDLDDNEIPEIVVYSEGISGAMYLHSVFSFDGDGQKYVEGTIEGYDSAEITGTGMIKAYKKAGTGEFVFRAGDMSWDMVSSDDVLPFTGSYYGNFHVSREFDFEDGVLSFTEYDHSETMLKLESMFSEDSIEELKKLREVVKDFEKEYSVADEYKSIFVRIRSTEEYTANENDDVFDIYHTYVDEAFAKEFVKAYLDGVKEMLLPEYRITWEKGIENLVTDYWSWPDDWRMNEIVTFVMTDFNKDKNPEVLVGWESPVGGHTGTLGVCEWNENSCVYEVNELDETVPGTLSICKDNSTGETGMYMGLIKSSWFESDNMDEYSQIWREDGNFRKITYADGELKFEEISNFDDELDLLGDLDKDDASRRKALETLRKEADEREKNYTETMSCGELSVTAYAHQEVEIPDDYYTSPHEFDPVNPETIEKAITNFKNTIG